MRLRSGCLAMPPLPDAAVAAARPAFFPPIATADGAAPPAPTIAADVSSPAAAASAVRGDGGAVTRLYTRSSSSPVWERR